MLEQEKNTWLSFNDLVKNSLGNARTKSFVEIFQKLLKSKKMLSRSINIKLHFLLSNLFNFAEVILTSAMS